MGPDFGLFVLVLLAIAAVPLTILGLLIAVFRRQREDSDALSGRLNRIERALERQRDLLKKMEAVDRAAPQAQTPAAKASPVKPPAMARGEKPTEAVVLAEPVPEPPPLPATSVSKTAATPAPSFLEPAATLAATVAQKSQPADHPQEPIRESVRPADSWTSPPPAEPSRFEVAAQEILRKIGRWILIGEDEVPEGVSMEYAIASNWLLRIGVLILVMGVGYFLKYSIDMGWLDHVGQVSLGTIAGLAMLVAGTQMLGRKYHLFGQGMIGAGIATLYMCVFVAHSKEFGLIPNAMIAFALMSAVTCLAGGVAVRFNSILVAVLGILGGYGTPVMLQTGVVNYVGLYSYLLILGIGVLGISIKKNWHLLNYLSFVGTYALLFSSMADWHYGPSSFWLVMPFLVAFFILFSTLTFLFNLVNQKKSNLLEVLGLWINAAVFFVVSYWMVRGAYSERWVAAVSLSLAAFYTAHVYYFLVRRLKDRALMLSFTALAAFFVAVTIPLLLSHQWITPCWAIQALVMLWIAGKLESEFLRQVAYVLYAIVLGRFAIFDLQAQYLHHSAGESKIAIGQYLWQMVERLAVFGVPIASMAGAGWLLRQAPPKPLSPVGRDNDVPPWLGVSKATAAVVVVVVGMTFVALHLELNRSLGHFFDPLRLPGMSLLWVAMCVLLLRQYCLRRSEVFMQLLLLFAGGMLAKLFIFDLPAWHVLPGMIYGGREYLFLDASMRLLDFGAMIALFGFGFYLLRAISGDTRAKVASQVAATAAVALLFLFLTLEVNTYLKHFIPGLRAGGVSILWAVFALALIIGGMWKDLRAVRYVGLALFAVVSAKVLLSDLAHLEQIYRIIAFIILGVVVLSGSFVYIKCRPMLTAKKRETEP